MIWSGLFSYNAGFVSYSIPDKVDPYENVIWITCIIGPFVLATLYFLYLRSKGKHKIVFWLGKKMPTEYSDLVFREIQTVLATAMLKRDRYMLANKKGMIRKYMRGKCAAKTLDTDDIVEVFLGERIPVMELMDWCVLFLSYEQKLETFEFLSRVAMMDSELADAEREYLLFVIQKFTLRSEDVSKEIGEQLFGKKEKPVKTQVSGVHRYYEILELHVTATDKEVKESYRRLVKKFHPDSHPHVSGEEKKRLSDKFQEVQEAYDQIISN